MVLASVVFIVLGAISVATPWLATRYASVRLTLRRAYSNPAMLLPIRVGPATAPIYGVGAILFGLATLLPARWGAWVAWPALACIGLAIVLAYRMPARITPSWLRADLLEGLLAPARPDLFDWAFLALVGPVLILALVTWPYLVMTQLRV